MKDIKVAFIGLGGRGMSLLKDIVLPQGEIVTAVCDLYEDRANAGADEVEKVLNVRPKVYFDYKEIC